MSFDQLSSLEAGRHGESGGYSDDPGFKTLLHELRTKLSDLERNILKLRTDVNLLGTRRDTARVRERVHDFLEKSRDTCLELGEGIKKLQTWDELSVRISPYFLYFSLLPYYHSLSLLVSRSLVCFY